MTKSKAGPPIVEVIWDDIHSSWGWEPVMDYIQQEPLPCSTVGYLIEGDLKQSDKVVVVTSLGHWSMVGALGGEKPETASGSTVIPRGCITKIRRLN